MEPLPAQDPSRPHTPPERIRRTPGEKGLRLRHAVMTVYDFIIDVVIIGLILVMLVTLGFAFFELLISLKTIVPLVKPSTIGDIDLKVLVENVLDVFVVVELFGAFTNYFRTRHVRLASLLDVTIVFALREILVKLYAKNESVTDLIGLCLLALILVLAKILTVQFAEPAPVHTYEKHE